MSTIINDLEAKLKWHRKELRRFKRRLHNTAQWHHAAPTQDAKDALQHQLAINDLTHKLIIARANINFF